jgi:hypothetical protein
MGHLAALNPDCCPNRILQSHRSGSITGSTSCLFTSAFIVPFYSRASFIPVWDLCNRRRVIPDCRVTLEDSCLLRGRRMENETDGKAHRENPH